MTDLSSTVSSRFGVFVVACVGYHRRSHVHYTGFPYTRLYAVNWGTPERWEGRPAVHFFYEADRGTVVLTDMLKKFRGYHHFIKKQQRHKEAFGILSGRYSSRRLTKREEGV